MREDKTASFRQVKIKRGLSNNFKFTMMKPNQTNLKLKLNKQSVSHLSKADLQKINGGEEAALTTSAFGCSGFTCCNASSTCTIVQTIIQTIVGTATPKL